MKLEERKLQVIQRCMNIDDETELRIIEEAMNSVEIDRRAKASERDIQYGKVSDYKQFSEQVQSWLREIKRSA